MHKTPKIRQTKRRSSASHTCFFCAVKLSLFVHKQGLLAWACLERCDTPYSLFQKPSKVGKAAAATKGPVAMPGARLAMPLKTAGREVKRPMDRGACEAA